MEDPEFGTEPLWLLENLMKFGAETLTINVGLPDVASSGALQLRYPSKSVPEMLFNPDNVNLINVRWEVLVTLTEGFCESQVAARDDFIDRFWSKFLSTFHTIT